MPGLVNGKLAPPPFGTRCVCSEYSDSRAFVEPLSFEGDATAAWLQLKDLIESVPRIVIHELTGTYLRAVSRTRVLRLADDLEFRLHAEASVIHVRSASQIGFFDFGVNNRRVAAIRIEWNRRLPIGTLESGAQA